MSLQLRDIIEMLWTAGGCLWWLSCGLEILPMHTCEFYCVTHMPPTSTLHPGAVVNLFKAFYIYQTNLI